jgi:F0F1-type ATP synthase membrane subunit a
MFSLLLFQIFEDRMMKIITTVGMLIASIMAFITPSNMIILSQVNYPPLITNNYSVNILIGILMLFITIIMQIKKEKNISVD